VTPVLHNAPTVFVRGSIAASLAVKLGLNPDTFMIAVRFSTQVGLGSKLV